MEICVSISQKNIVFAFLGFILSFAVFADHAAASGITFDVISPHEYGFPVNYESFNAFAQYGYYQHDSKSFDSNGKTVTGPGTDTAVGLSKYVRFFSIKSLPDVGFAYLVFLPEISVQAPGVSVNGLGDPLTGPAAWIKPTKNSTVGFQTYLQVPVGTKEVSDRTWANISTIFWDWQLGDFNVDGDFGAQFKSVRHTTGANDVDPGSTLFSNLRLAYRAHKYFEPYFSVDYQTTGTSKDKVTGVNVPDSANNETAVGGGIMFHFSDTINLSTRYTYGVDGKNTPVTNALNFKFTYIW